MLSTQKAVLLEMLLQTIVLMQTKKVKLGQKRDIVGAGCQNGEIILENGTHVIAPPPGDRPALVIYGLKNAR